VILDRLAPVLLTITAGALTGLAVWAGLATVDYLTARRNRP
jgi:hypothetical protein